MNTEEKTSLTVSKVIKAPPNRVYSAWTDPEQMKQWFGSIETRTRNLVADPRVKGKFRWDLISADGEEMTAFGEYVEVIQDEKIVFTWKWDDDEDWEDIVSTVTIALTDEGDGTRVTLTHERLPSEASRDRHHEGWSIFLVSLERYFNKSENQEMK